MPTDIDPELILDALADGLSTEKVSRRYRVPLDEVRRIMKEATERCYDGAHLREHWMLEDRRLYAMELKFWHKAMEDNGSPADAMVAVKTSERRAVLAGANMPQSHVLAVVSQPTERRTSTERIGDVLDTLLGITDREKELRARDSAGEITADEAEEYRQFQYDRELKRREEIDRTWPSSACRDLK